MLAEPTPQLVILDEPTNGLDLATVDALVQSLQGFHGALLVASHDADFLADLGVTTTWVVEPGGVTTMPS